MCINGSLKILKGSRINGDSIGVLALGSEIIAMTICTSQCCYRINI